MDTLFYMQSNTKIRSIFHRHASVHAALTSLYWWFSSPINALRILLQETLWRSVWHQVCA